MQLEKTRCSSYVKTGVWFVNNNHPHSVPIPGRPNVKVYCSEYGIVCLATIHAGPPLQRHTNSLFHVKLPQKEHYTEMNGTEVKQFSKKKN